MPDTKQTPEVRYACYKQKRYQLKYLGTTKFAQRARLAYLDGSKEFWVDADAVMVDNEELPPRTDQQQGAPAPSQRENMPKKATCPVCHEAPAEVEHPEHAGTLICGGCFLAIGSSDIPY